MNVDFVNLGIHTPYELLNGSGDLALWVRKAQYLNQKALGICDRNTMAATLNLQKECAKNGIRHVFGYSFTLEHLEEKVDMKVYCQSQKGLNNLLRIQKEIMVDADTHMITLPGLLSHAEGNILVIGKLSVYWMQQYPHLVALLEKEFDKVFKELFGGGRGTIELVEGDDILEAGIVIISQPPGKKLQNMMQLSGGEKALTAIALLFAIQNLKPSPFCLLDEIEAALDDSNVGRFANYLHKLTKHTQFIVITHRRGTMSAADRLYGITMQEKGVSTLVSVDLIANDLDKDNKKE